MAGNAKKVGRGKRSPSRASYKAELRKERNARIKQARHKAACEAKRRNPPRIPRGTARARRRGNPTVLVSVN